MSIRRVIARNIAFNWSGRIAEGFVGFFIAPFLVHRLGATNYGLWTVIASLTGYFGLLDLGVQNSVGRYVAFYRAKEDRIALNSVVSTAAMLLSAVGIFALIAMLAVQLFFFQIFEVAPAEVSGARWALTLVGINLAISFPLSLFDATLWGFQRFDCLGIVESVSAIMRAVLTLVLIRAGHGLIVLAVITLMTTVLSAIAKAILTFREDRSLSILPRYFDRGIVLELFKYSVWRMFMAAGRISTTRINPFLIGAWLTMALVTPYALAARLMSYCTELFLAARAVLIPMATAFEAKGNHDWQRKLILKGGQYCSAFALFLLVLFAFLGRPLLTLWVGTDLAYASNLLTIIMLGELLAISQSATTSMLLGMNRHQMLAVLSVVEIAGTLVLAIALIGPYGLVGVCIAQAITAFVCRGVLQLIYACWVIDFPAWKYLQAIAPLVGVAALPTAFLGLLVMWHGPENWIELIAYASVYGLAYAVSFLFWLGLDRVRAYAIQLIWADS
jgi:O-antigen/teichoic acid export membrane protein